MPNVTVTIGRNVGEQPMAPASWRSFRRAVHDVLAATDATLYTDGARYRGRWGETYEDAAIWLAAVDDVHLSAVRTALASLASAYDQDAIGVTVGVGELVTP